MWSRWNNNKELEDAANKVYATLDKQRKLLEEFEEECKQREDKSPMSPEEESFVERIKRMHDKHQQEKEREWARGESERARKHVIEDLRAIAARSTWVEDYLVEAYDIVTKHNSEFQDEYHISDDDVLLAWETKRMNFVMMHLHRFS